MRLLHLWQTHDQLVSRTLMGDALAYDAWARRIAAGDWLGREVFYQSPLYPYGLAAIYGLSGGSIVAARIVQSILGAVSCALLAKAAERFFDRRVGWVVGIMMAVYPTGIFFDGIIQKSSLDLLLVALLLFLVARATPETRGLGWLAIGATLGALILNRENALLLVAPLSLWVILHWLRLMGRKLLLLVNSVEIADTEDLYTWAESSWVLAVTTPVLHMGLIAPLAAVGIVVTWSSGRKLWILRALLLTYAASVLLFFVNARYRYPLVPMLVPLAGAAIAYPWRQSLSQRRYKQLAVALAVAFAVGLLSNRSIIDVDAMRAVTVLNLGAYLAERGETGLAVKCFSRAIELQPAFADAHYNLGQALVDMGRLDEAVAPFARAAELAPGEPKARQALRWIESRKGDAAKQGAP